MEVLVAWRFRPGLSKIEALVVGLGLSVCHCFEMAGRAASADFGRSSGGMEGFEFSGCVEGEVASVDAGLVVMMDFGEPQRLGTRYSIPVLKARIRGRRKKEAKVNLKLGDSRKKRKEKKWKETRERASVSFKLRLCTSLNSVLHHDLDARAQNLATSSFRCAKC
jgi:hypothetical protein